MATAEKSNWPWGLTLSLALTLILGMASVWLNIERVDLGYELRNLERTLDAERETLAKLEVERDNLLSPYRLQLLAKKFGLGPVKAGQVRQAHLPDPEKQKGTEESNGEQE